MRKEHKQTFRDGNIVTSPPKAKLPVHRQKRLQVLVRAFVKHENDVQEAIKQVLAELTPEDALELLEDPWFRRNFSDTASELLEMGILLNVVELAMVKGPQAMQAVKIALPAINKHRYNPAVQAQETANEGIARALEAVARKPMTTTQIINFFTAEESFVPIREMEKLEVPSLDQAIETAKVDGTYKVVNTRIVEDRDLRER